MPKISKILFGLVIAILVFNCCGAELAEAAIDALMNMDFVFCKDNKTLYMLEFGTDGNPLAVRHYTVSGPYKDFAQKVKVFWDALHQDGEDPSRDCLSYWAEKTFVKDLGFGHFEARGITY